MKKIIRLTESDLNKLVRRIINEQYNAGKIAYTNQVQKKVVPPTAGTGNAPQGSNWMDKYKPTPTGPSGVKGTPVRFYKDEANKLPYNTIFYIKSEIKTGNSVSIDIDNFQTNMKFDCKTNYVTSPAGQALYNKNYIADLKKKYCTTSAGGTPVTNIGKYSSVDSNQPNTYV
jgi:hypothetical protein